jgi:hypothetical protein
MQLWKENSCAIGLERRISPAQRLNPKQLLNGLCRTVWSTSHMVAALILSKGTAQ